MGYLAATTETIEIGSASLNVYSRTPGALLQTAFRPSATRRCWAVVVGRKAVTVAFR